MLEEETPNKLNDMVGVVARDAKSFALLIFCSQEDIFDQSEGSPRAMLRNRQETNERMLTIPSISDSAPWQAISKMTASASSGSVHNFLLFAITLNRSLSFLATSLADVNICWRISSAA